jgi:hypothetical protein
MDDNLRERFSELSTDYLVEQYTKKREEYTPEALEAIAAELKERDVDQQELQRYREANAESQEAARKFSRNDFVPLEQKFTRTDLLIAHAMLRDEQIPFIVETSSLTGDMIPLETVSAPNYTVQVHRDSLERARALLEEHFHSQGGQYKSKYSSPRERLKSFQFHEVHLSESQLHESVDLQFTREERAAIVGYLKRLEQEADAIEEQTGRVIFYYDTLQETAELLEKGKDTELEMTDLLTVLEALQIYCEDPEYPEFLDSVAEGLLNILSEG